MNDLVELIRARIKQYYDLYESHPQYFIIEPTMAESLAAKHGPHVFEYIEKNLKIEIVMARTNYDGVHEMAFGETFLKYKFS